MSELPIKTGYSVIWAYDLKDYFMKIAGREWELNKAEMFPAQNTMITVTVPDEENTEIDGDKEDWWDEYGFSMDRWFKGGDFYNAPYEDDDAGPRVGHVLQWLYEREMLPAGEYIVEVSW